MARIIALVNQKGGVGKTTSAINIGAGLHRAGKRVLLVDLDPQGNLTVSVGIQADPLKNTMLEVLNGDCTAADAIINRGYDVLPADIRLSGAELGLSAVPGREMLLKEALELIADRYEYIFIDCPPSLGLITLNGLTAANELFIPLQAEFLALNGISQLLTTIQAVKKRLNPQLGIAGIIVTMYDRRKKLNKEVSEIIQKHFGDNTFKTMIRDNIAIAEAPSHGLDIFEYKSDSYGAEDYAALTDEILRRAKQ